VLALFAPALDPPGAVLVDATLGRAGHARALLAAHPHLALVGIDTDASAIAESSRLLAPYTDRVTLAHAVYDQIAGVLARQGVARVQGVLFDLGVSSPQLDEPGRGFAYSYDAPLDMRMDPGQSLSAATVVNEWPQDRLALAIREFGEERRAGSIAREITKRRPIETTAQLVAAIKAALPPSERFGRGHPAKRTFQAIRIAVNGELDALDHALPLAWTILPVGGRLGAISFHSLEDRRVKRFLADRARGCVCPPELPVCVCGREPEAELLTKRAIAPRPEELERNPRAGSAHLRAALKVREAEEND
jgi:16S rRNA (cytosine1402-N4)-methyltransferase